MKKTGKLLVLTAVLGLMIGAAQAAKDLNGKKQAEEEKAEKKTVIFSTDPGRGTDLSFTVGENSLSFKKADDVWTVTETPEYPLDGEKIEELLESLEEVTSFRTIEKISDASDYGLAEPECTVTLDGKTLSFGNIQELDGYVYTSNGDGNVYLVDTSVMEAFQTDLDNLLRMEEIPQMTDLVSFRVDTPDGTYEIVHLPESGIAYSDAYVYFMKDGEEYTALDTSLATAFLENVTQLKREACIEWNADEDLLQNSGLAEPQVRVTVTYTETEKIETEETDSDGNTIFETKEKPCTFVLNLSGSYARIGDSRMIYRIDSALEVKLRYTTVTELLPEDVLALDFSDVLSVDVSIGEDRFSLERKAETMTDANGETDIEVKWERKNSSGESENGSVSDDFAESILEMSSEGSAWNAEPGEEEITLMLHRSDKTHPETELKFCRYDSKNCVTLIDGKPTVFVRRDDVETLCTALHSAAAKLSEE